MIIFGWMWEGFVSGVMKIAGLWWLVLLFIGIQILKDNGLLARVSQWMRPILAPLRLPGEAGVPVAAGMAIGLTYGSGVILQTGEEGKLTRAELTVACVFLGICHALIEETLLFSVAGASGTILVITRVAAGFIFGFGASRVLLKPRA